MDNTSVVFFEGETMSMTLATGETINVTGATESTTAGHEDSTRLSWTSVIVGVALYSIVLITVVGNALVLIAVARTKRLQTVFNLYIVNLAFTDISVALGAMSFYTTENILGYWPFGEFMCGVWIFFDYGMTFASVFTLLAISVDRYWSVRWSVHYRSMKTRRTAVVGIAMTWITMLILWLPPCITDRLANSSPGECIWEPSKNQEFVIVIAVIGHHGSCAVILFCYVSVCVILHKRAKVGIARRTQRIQRPLGTPTRITTQLTQDPEFETMITSSATDLTKDATFAKTSTAASSKSRRKTLQIPGASKRGGRKAIEPSRKIFCVTDNVTSTCFRTQARDRQTINKSSAAKKEEGRTRKENRAFVTLSYIVITYMVCWVPFHVVFDISAIRPEAVPELVYTVTFWLTYINSTVNPILYNFSSQEFRRAFYEICRIRR